jgi:protocatechuate 3,4-dioxygenase beta subunit
MSLAAALVLVLPFAASGADVVPSTHSTARDASAPAAAPSTTAAPAAPEAVAIHARLLDLNDAIRRARVRLERGGEPPPRTAPGAPSEPERLRAALDRLGGDVSRLADDGERRSLARKVSRLRQLAGDLERLEAGHSTPAAAERVRRALRWTVAADHGGCRSALPLAAGEAIAGDTAERAGGGPAGEAWFRLTATEGGSLTLDTRGSDFDTTLAVFDRCPDTPGGASAALAADDDSYGLAARLALTLDPGAESWIRLSGFAGSGGRFELAAGSFGVIAGTVTHSSDGSPVYGYVDAFDAAGFYAGTDEVNGGAYAIAGLAAGTYFVRTDTYYGLIDEVYDDIPCDGCSPTTGDPVAVQADQLTPDIDFALSGGGAITGRLRDQASGLPIIEGSVRVVDSNGSWVGGGYPDEAGRWTVGGLAPGSYRVFTEVWTHANEIFDDIPCAPSCDASAGTPIQVAADHTTRGIDFVLSKLGEITGTVTAADGGAPISYADVLVWSTGGGYYYADADALGRYAVGGLPAGTYYARTDFYGGFRNEVWDDIPCAGPYTCDTSGATPIVVAANATVQGIDFALDRTGAIAGTVVFEADGAPVAGASIDVWTTGGSYVNSAWTGSAGNYGVGNVYPGTHAVIASDDSYDPSGFLGELYDDLPCDPSCDPAAGTPVPVGAGATTSGIDLEVTPLGWIEGTVDEAGSGAPLGEVQVEVYDSSGDLLYYAGTVTDSSGHYVTGALRPGSYFVVAGSSSHLHELYDDLPCPGGGWYGCEPTTGTPIPVALESATTGIDFALAKRGSFSGSLTDATTGAAVSGTVQIWSAGGTYLHLVSTDAGGSFHSGGLAPGTYFAVAVSWTHSDELYDDLPCPDGGWYGCDPTTGTPIAVSLGTETSGIDFALDPLGSLAGRVTDALTGSPIGSGYVEVYRPDGQWASYGSIGSDGTFAVHGLAPGTYFAISGVFLDYANEIYDDLPCAYPCDPTTGTPIAVSQAATTAGIDIALEPSGGIAGRVTDTTGTPLAGVAIDFWYSDGSYAGATATDADGRYSRSLYSDSYFVSTDNGVGMVDAIYDDVPCPLGPAYDGLCDPATGDPVAVIYNLPFVRDVDFTLAGGPLFADGFESGDLSAWSAAVGD